MIIVRYQGMVLRYPDGHTVKKANEGTVIGWDILDKSERWLVTVPVTAVIESSAAKPEITQQREIFE